MYNRSVTVLSSFRFLLGSFIAQIVHMCLQTLLRYRAFVQTYLLSTLPSVICQLGISSILCLYSSTRLNIETLNIYFQNNENIIFQ